MTKKEQIDFLSSKVNECVKIILENEVNLKVLMTQELKAPLSKELLQAKNQMISNKDVYNLKLKTYKNVIDSIEKGELKI